LILDIKVFAVGPKASLKEIPPLLVSGAQMDIDLVQISKNNNGSAAVAFMSFTNMGSFLSPNLFSSTNDTEKTMLSSVISATLPKTNDTKLLTPVNFTLKHTAELDPKGTLSCVYWKETEWAVDGCHTIPTNDSSTVCSCVHLSTFAVIMETTKAPTAFFVEPPGKKLLEEILNKTFTELPKTVVVDVLKQVMNETLISLATNEDKVNKVEHVNNVLMATEKLVSALVTNVETYNVTPIFLPNLEIQIFTVGPNASLKDILPLNTSTAVLDIDIIEIAKRNNGSAAVAFMSYTNISNMMDPDLFTTNENTTKIMMSTVVSATLIKITDTKLTKPVNFTFKHTADLIPDSNLTCVYWNKTVWVVDGCNLLQTSRSHTVCSCDHLSTFALIMQTKPPKNDDPLDLLSTVLVSVGLVFLSLALLTFVIFRRKLRANNTPRINLCISLLLAHLTFLLTQNFIHYIQPDQLLCAVLAGVLHFLFLSAFVWMLIEAVLLLISVKNLTKIRSKQKEVLGWKRQIVIGYVIPLVVVCVSVGLFPGGYGSKECWLKFDKDLFWSFLGPVCFILALNLILFIIIGVIMISTLRKRNNPTLQKKATRSDDNKLVKSVMYKTLLQFIIIGCFWTVGFFTESSDVVKILFLIVNSQQGTFIFLIHCALNYEVRLEPQQSHWTGEIEGKRCS
ncbi:adhesion G protein-coupled receptor E3-like, partial [Astyanax mexicanus]